MKIEMRWLERKTGRNIMNEYGWVEPEIIKVLQYRQAKQIFSSSSFGERTEVIDWEDWQDVPTVREDNESN